MGEFARHGRVSVRMLRHYDAIGLLRPAAVDAATGYRLGQVQAILAEQVSAAELRGILRGYAREVTLEHHEDPDLWVTELQPIECE